MARILFTVLLATAAVLACCAAPLPEAASKIGAPVTVNGVARTETWRSHRPSKMPSSHGKKKYRKMQKRKKEMRNSNKRFSDGDGGSHRQLKTHLGWNKKNRLAKKNKLNKRNRLAKKNNRPRKNKFNKKRRSSKKGRSRMHSQKIRSKKPRSRHPKKHPSSRKGRSRKDFKKNAYNERYEHDSYRELSMEAAPVGDAPSVIHTKKGDRRSPKGKKKNRSGKNKLSKKRRSSKKIRSRKGSKKSKSNKRKSRHQKKPRSSNKRRSRMRGD